MTNTIAFPRLFDAVFQIDRTAFSVLGLHIQWYGVIIMLGMALAVAYALWRAPRFGLSADRMSDVLLVAIPAGIVGARLYYVANSWSYYSRHPGDIIKTWEGGLAIYGGVIFGFLAAFIYCRIRKIDFLAVADLASLGYLIGQCVGRWGNFVNAEAFGGPTDLPWGMSLGGGPPVHPTFLYESLWTLAGFVALHLYSRRPRPRGRILLLYLGWYGLGRAWIEGLRTDSLYLGSTDIRVSQALAVACVAVSLGLLACFHLIGKHEISPPTGAKPSIQTPQEEAEHDTH